MAIDKKVILVLENEPGEQEVFSNYSKKVVLELLSPIPTKNLNVNSPMKTLTLLF